MVAALGTEMNRSVKMLNVNKPPTRPKKRRKITLVFDEDKRREFLGGFRKRKLERQKKAQEELQQRLKEERKKMKQEAREKMKKLLSSRDIPELQTLLSQKEYETEGHTVSILELNVADLAEGGKWIGENKGTNEEDEAQNSDELSEKEEEDKDEIIGMPVQKTNKKKKTNKKNFRRPYKTKIHNSKKKLKK